MEVVEDVCVWFPLGDAFSFHVADFAVSVFWGRRQETVGHVEGPVETE